MLTMLILCSIISLNVTIQKVSRRYMIMYRAPHKCPVCQSKMVVTQLSCPTCQSRLEGTFDRCLFCSLSPEETRFLITFIKNRGNIKDVERELGVSYPTVRAALDELILSLGLSDADKGDSDDEYDSARNPDDNDVKNKRRNDTTEKANARKDILNLLAQHRITADEAAQRLKKL